MAALIIGFDDGEAADAAQQHLVDRGYVLCPDNVWRHHARRADVIREMMSGDEADEIIDKQEALDLQREQEAAYERASGATSERMG